MLRRFAILALAIALPLAAQEGDAPPAARQACLEWLSLLDGRLYSDAYDQATSVFRSQVSRQRWQTLAESSRGKFGATAEREIVGAIKQALPIHDGQIDFWAFTIQVTFADGAKAFETASFASEDGAWKAIGYRIRPLSSPISEPQD